MKRRFLRALKKVADDASTYSDDRLRELARRPADRKQMQTVLDDLERSLSNSARRGMRHPTISAAHLQADRLRKALAEVPA